MAVCALFWFGYTILYLKTGKIVKKILTDWPCLLNLQSFVHIWAWNIQETKNKNDENKNLRNHELCTVYPQFWCWSTTSYLEIGKINRICLEFASTDLQNHISCTHMPTHTTHLSYTPWYKNSYTLSYVYMQTHTCSYTGLNICTYILYTNIYTHLKDTYIQIYTHRYRYMCWVSGSIMK